MSFWQNKQREIKREKVEDIGFYIIIILTLIWAFWMVFLR